MTLLREGIASEGGLVGAERRGDPRTRNGDPGHLIAKDHAPQFLSQLYCLLGIIRFAETPG